MKHYRLMLILGMLFLTSFLCGFVWINSESEMRSTSTVNEEVQTQTSAVDSKAVDLLRESLNYLSKLTKFSVQAQSTYEDVLDSGHRVDFEMFSSVTVNRPNKFHAERHGELVNQIFYYDGNTLTLYNPSDKVYATEPAPGTIDDMLHFARDTYGLGAPVSDLIYNNAFSLLIQDVNFAVVIGKEMIGKVSCDHLLFSRPGVDFQIWIAEGDSPLPFKYVVTDTATPELLGFVTYMRNWEITPIVTESLFKFEPPKGTKKITFLKAEQSGEPKQ